MNFNEELAARCVRVNRIIADYLPREEGFSADMARAMNYSMMAGGKRLRPIFMEEAYRCWGGSGKVIQPFMTAMEMIHTHSLIHDDLPAIDNDMFRRGMKTTHAEFGEAMGILSGDALLNYAYEVALTSANSEEKNPYIIKALTILADKSGIRGMLGGQSVDVTNEGRDISEEMLMYIYQYKTSALIEASLMVGAVLAGASTEDVDIMEQVGNRVGLAFQIQDDILDITATQQELGKPICSDKKNKKVTYVSLHGIEAAAREVGSLSAEAIELLHSLDRECDFLRELIDYLVTRRK